MLFAASFTPSLVPRAGLLQGVLAGASFAAGYGLGTLGRALWRYLELPRLDGVLPRALGALFLLMSTTIAAICLMRAADWQNSVRAVLSMEPVPESFRIQIILIASATFLVLLGIARLLFHTGALIARASRRALPPRLANLAGIAITAALVWIVATDVVIRAAFRVLDASFQEIDARFEPESPRPLGALATGSDASLVAWDGLGRAGREFVASAPPAHEIAAQIGRPAVDPLRIYVGLRNAPNPEARAQLALAELRRQHAFERQALVVITPTGTGWIDPAAIDTVEFLHGGNIASVAVQYSYLNSPLTLLFDADYGAESARAVFRVIYGYWTTLAKATRPRLYLHGLSLGAMNSEQSVGLFETLEDPINGALWSGPPFTARTWRAITDQRERGTPEWLPRFRDDRVVRFANQKGMTTPPDTPWGPTRLVYLQYASDGITFFGYESFWRAPAWTEAPRGPDVSPELRWYPVTTFLQGVVDLMTVTSTPPGYGHVFAAEHYVDPWIAITALDGWIPDALARLKIGLGTRQRSRSETAAYEHRDG
ncbi:MAG: alpha/beta-hydrolase family protein [Burkholderiales bacterium]